MCRNCSTLNRKGIDFNQQDSDGYNALHFASSRGHIEIVQLLLEKGIDINQTTSNRWNALHLALREDHLEIALLLIVKAININQINKYGESLLQYF